MRKLFTDLKTFFLQCRSQDFGFYMAAGYLIFSYLRPQIIYPALDILPWTQVCILFGLGFIFVKGYFRFQLPHFAMVVFTLVCWLSAYNSHVPEYSLSKIDVMYIWTLEVIFFTNCIRNLQQFRLITILFFLILFKISFFGARTWVERGFGFRDFGIAGPSGFFANSGELSLLIAMLAIMCITFYMANKPIRKIYYLLPVTCVMTVLAASSRGGQLALIVGLLLIGVMLGKLKFKNIILTCLVASICYWALPEEQKERFQSAGDDGTSTSRLLYWEAGLDMLEKNPLLGVGYYGFPSYFHKHYTHLLPEGVSYGNRREVAHNTLIEVSSGTGYIGLACFLWLYWLVLSLNRKTRKILMWHPDNENNQWLGIYSKGLDISMAVFFVGSFFMSVAYYPYMYFMLMFSQSMANAALDVVTVSKNTSFKKRAENNA